ncbi:MAG: B12-binding domain-containing protein [Coriobacteriales bacterium]|jgi:methanogenic corrinoid protein MtbC1|nr:B12-binding domain-containing protein [Coriobacteriales bacterium]
MSILDDISAAVQAGKKKDVEELVQKAIDEGCSAQDILNDGLLAAMEIIGPKFKNNEIFVPEVLVAARAMNAGTALLKPLMVEAGVKPIGKAVIGTVKGDMHDIGKNLVRMMIEGANVDITDLGVDVAPEAFADFVKANADTDLVCLSALLTTTLPSMADCVKAVKETGAPVKILIGGAPVTQELADELGANGYAPDAGSAAAKAVELLS